MVKLVLVFIIGPTQRSFLDNIEGIIGSALPTNKLVQYITLPAAQDYLLKKISFCEEMRKVSTTTQLAINYYFVKVLCSTSAHFASCIGNDE